MKVGIASVQVPFIYGGAEILAESLKRELIKRKIEAEIITMPFKWYPPECILDHMLAARLLDVTEVNGQSIDRLVTLKFPAYYFSHSNKVAWILHQHRQAYDLYETEYGDLHLTETGRIIAQEIYRWDQRLLLQHKALFTIAHKVTNRLQYYNSLAAETLYPPPSNHECFRCEDYQHFVLAPGRFDVIKRQHLIVEAMSKAPAHLKLVLIGQANNAYGDQLFRMIHHMGLENRIIVRGSVTEEEKLDLYARCLAVYNGVYDEDYGYVTLEAFLASKPVITHTDSGGPLEFVVDQENGFVVSPEPARIADCLHKLVEYPQQARKMGQTGKLILADKHISWDYVIERLLS